MQDDPRWSLADPICTFVFAALVLLTTRAILRDISDILMERVPRSQNAETITAALFAVGHLLLMCREAAWLISTKDCIRSCRGQTCTSVTTCRPTDLQRARIPVDAISLEIRQSISRVADSTY